MYSKYSNILTPQTTEVCVYSSISTEKHLLAVLSVSEFLLCHHPGTTHCFVLSSTYLLAICLRFMHHCHKWSTFLIYLKINAAVCCDVQILHVLRES